MLRVLIVSTEDASLQVSGVARFVAALEQGGMSTCCADGNGTTDELRQSCAGQLPDLVIADLRYAFDALPLRHLRRKIAQAWHDDDDETIPPLLALLSERQLAGRDWLPLVDDFLAPPHTTEELLTRLRLLLFRRRQVENGDTIRFRDVILELLNGTVRVAGTGTAVALTPREWDLLRFLLTHRGKLFSRDRLLDLVWGVDYAGGPRTVDIHIRRLRAKLPPESSAALENRRGLGYGFTTAVPGSGPTLPGY